MSTMPCGSLVQIAPVKEAMAEVAPNIATEAIAAQAPLNHLLFIFCLMECSLSAMLL